MSVIEHDFGKEAREHAARLGRLLGIVEEYHADILRNPLPHIQAAGAEIARLHIALDAALDALRKPFSYFAPLDTPAPPEDFSIMVLRDEWEALKRMKAVIEAAAAAKPTTRP